MLSSILMFWKEAKRFLGTVQQLHYFERRFKSTSTLYLLTPCLRNRICCTGPIMFVVQDKLYKLCRSAIGSLYDKLSSCQVDWGEDWKMVSANKRAALFSFPLATSQSWQCCISIILKEIPELQKRNAKESKKVTLICVGVWWSGARRSRGAAVAVMRTRFRLLFQRHSLKSQTSYPLSPPWNDIQIAPHLSFELTFPL